MSELFASTASQPTLGEGGDDADPGLWPELASVTRSTAAAYRVLARKYRPTNFEQLIGQDAMVRTLSNAIETGRLPHAWMLTGVRGIGKTTTARIIARALNCTGADGHGGPTIQPCGICDACRAIAEDRHVDVMEMDAASRTGVDDIRDIIDGVRYGPVSARYKIYILDEVHMLSKNAFNALLKTLEEPPPHTKFIFATTEIRKVPVTVLSRCQRFDLRRISSAMLAAHFADVATKEGASIEPEAVRLIAHAADGSVRDGLSLLDQAIARGKDQVTAADVNDMLGLADRGQSLALCRNLLRGEMSSALGTFQAMQQAGSDPLQILQDMCELVHLLTRGQVIERLSDDSSLPEYDRHFLVEMSDFKVPALARAWQILLKGIAEVQSAPHPAQAAEMVLIRMAYASELPTPSELIKQIRDQPMGATAAPEPARPSGGPQALRGGGRSDMGGSGGAAALRAERVIPAPAVQAASATEALLAAHPMPETFRELVGLFAANREAPLHAQLYSNVHPVRLEDGHLEIRTGENAPSNLASQLTKFLTSWTGHRWMVSISGAQGAETLAEEDRAAEQKRHDTARQHPLMQAVMASFPDAKLTVLRQKPLAPVAELITLPAPADDLSTFNDED